MRVLVTGADGFIGRNLVLRLKELPSVDVSIYDRKGGLSQLSELVSHVDWVIHLAGVNRPDTMEEFNLANAGFTATLCDAIAASGHKPSIIYSSSIQVGQTGDYGESKLRAEKSLNALHEETGCSVHIYRLPNVFGKWARPNYNSVVATFCHNIARNIPIEIHDPDAVIRLVYIDDLVDSFLILLEDRPTNTLAFERVPTEYQVTVGEMATMIEEFRTSRVNLVMNAVGHGLLRAMYATYVSYLPENDFDYLLKKNADARGVFVEILKTKLSGQFSYFTALPGVTRGGHYHHTKTEKFLVISGEALFRFSHKVTGDYFEISVVGGDARVVETVPGWAHDITNVGENELICLLWANEIYDGDKSDTIFNPINKDSSPLR